MKELLWFLVKQPVKRKLGIFVVFLNWFCEIFPFCKLDHIRYLNLVDMLYLVCIVHVFINEIHNVHVFIYEIHSCTSQKYRYPFPVFLEFPYLFPSVADYIFTFWMKNSKDWIDTKMGNLLCCVQVKQSKVAIRERFGKFNSVLKPGCHCLPWICGYRLAGHLSLRLQQLEVRCETKTKVCILNNTFSLFHGNYVKFTLGRQKEKDYNVILP